MNFSTIKNSTSLCLIEIHIGPISFIITNNIDAARIYLMFSCVSFNNSAVNGILFTLRGRVSNDSGNLNAWWSAIIASVHIAKITRFPIASIA